MIKFLNTESFGQIPVRLSYYALKMFQATTGRSFMFGGAKDEIKLEDFEVLLYYSVEKACKSTGRSFSYTNRENQIVPFTMETMEDVLDESLMEFIEMIPEFFPGKKEGKVAETQEEKKQ